MVSFRVMFLRVDGDVRLAGWMMVVMAAEKAAVMVKNVMV